MGIISVINILLITAVLQFLWCSKFISDTILLPVYFFKNFVNNLTASSI